MNTRNELTGKALDQALEQCAREPVHIPGAIQPHGALISCDEGLEWIRQVSANLDTMLGIPADEALSLTPEQLLGKEWLERVREVIEGASRFPVLILPLQVAGRSQRFRVLPYRSGSRAVLELEPVRGQSERWLFSALAEWQTQLSRFHKRDDLHDAVTRLVRDLSGYDRVMIYRFDEDWNGSVVAESRGEDADSYLGHHFPASDIPEQVRRLYSIKPVRDIPDATADSVPLVPAADPDDDAPLDLSRGVLRAAAPIHRAYLANMGVVAAMSIPLHVEGRLWGLLACHALQPNVLPPALRDALRTMVQSASFQLELIESRQRARLIEQANNSRDLLLDERGEFPRPGVLVERHGQEWMEVFRACGVALIVGDGIAAVGDVPDKETLAQLLPKLSELSGSTPVWSTREIDRTPLSPPGLGRITGLLAAPLPVRQSMRGWLLLFRREKIEMRAWAGNPEKTLKKQGARLSPRSSFETWKERVRGRSEAWMAVERRVAIDLATDLAALVAANEISRLNEKLTELATHDHLTGVWSRYRMEEAIDHELAMAQRYGRQCSLLMFDIDHFKHFNDTFGHDAGDQVLVRIAEVVAGKVREADRVGRWGGEEFMVLAGDTDPEGARRLAGRLLRAIGALDLGDYGRVTASFGVATARAEEGRRELIKRADDALYAAKEAGRNRVEVAAAD
ncbi:MAG: diguanylate cyclase [Wenzhouxiangella sp.]